MLPVSYTSSVRDRQLNKTFSVGFHCLQLFHPRTLNVPSDITFIYDFWSILFQDRNSFGAGLSKVCVFVVFKMKFSSKTILQGCVAVRDGRTTGPYMWKNITVVQKSKCTLRKDCVVCWAWELTAAMFTMRLPSGNALYCIYSKSGHIVH